MKFFEETQNRALEVQDDTATKTTGIVEFNRMLSRQGSMASGIASQQVSRPETGLGQDQKIPRPRFHEPTISASMSTDYKKIIRPSSSAPAFKRLQDARKGHQPFNFEMPNQTITEMRCMLHPTMKRDWNYPEDTWFPGMMTKNKELREHQINDFASDERKVIPKQYFQTKLFKYNEADVEEARSKPIVRCGSAYVDPDRVVRQQQNDKDKQIICKKKVYDRVLKKERIVNVPFYTLFKNKATSESKKNLEDDKTDCTSAEYRPISAHKFRELDRGQWVSKQNFKLF